MTRTCSTPRSRIGFAGLAWLLLAAGCEDLTHDFDYDPEGVPLEEIIHLTRTGTGALSLSGGAPRDTFFARIPHDANTRSITFFTTAGVFELNNTRELKVRAERDAANPEGPLVARAVLRADTLTTTAVVSAMVADFRDTLWVPMIK